MGIRDLIYTPDNHHAQIYRKSIFAGSEIAVNLLNYELEKEGIPTNVINKYEQSNFRGFSTGTPYSVDLYILDTDLGKATPIVEEFMKINKM